jgi:hypothetical protein
MNGKPPNRLILRQVLKKTIRSGPGDYPSKRAIERGFAPAGSPDTAETEKSLVSIKVIFLPQNNPKNYHYVRHCIKS